MSIGEIVKKGKNIEEYAVILLSLLLIALVIFLGYGIERLASARSISNAVRLENTPLVNDLASSGGDLAKEVNKVESGHPEGLYKRGGLLVASKRGTKYHFPWCSGALSMKEVNKVWFSSKEEAERAGYSPATNCTGLLEIK